MFLLSHPMTMSPINSVIRKNGRKSHNQAQFFNKNTKHILDRIIIAYAGLSCIF